jgi:hypothetical protein
VGSACLPSLRRDGGFSTTFFKTLLQFLPPNGIFGIKNAQVVGSRPPQRQRWLFFDHIFGLTKDFNASLRRRWKVFYHFFGKGGSFSLTFLKKVVDFLSAILQ